MRIIILSDSLGRPRPHLAAEEATEYEQTYGYLLRTALDAADEVEIAYVESLDSIEARHWSQRMVAYRRPDVAIFHFGINDCAPRLFKKGNRALALRPWFRKATGDVVMKTMSRYRRHVTRLRPMTYTTPAEFEANLRHVVEDVRTYSPEASFIAISIALAPERLNRRSTGMNANVVAYNAIIERVFGDGYVEINELTGGESGLLSDGIHLTATSHERLAEELERRIRALPHSVSGTRPGAAPGTLPEAAPGAPLEAAE